MVAGDVYAVGPTLTGNVTGLRFQPAPGNEIVIHNISFSGAAKLRYTNETNSIDVTTAIESGALMGMFLHCTNTSYYYLVGTGFEDIYAAADGMCTK